jgi:hypothetical protein
MDTPNTTPGAILAQPIESVSICKSCNGKKQGCEYCTAFDSLLRQAEAEVDVRPKLPCPARADCTV